MDLSDITNWDYPLDQSLIAQHPAEPRGSSRLLCVRRNDGQLKDSVFSKLASEVSAGDLLVFNTTKVRKARLFGKKSSGAAVEMLVLRPEDTLNWRVLLRPGKKVPPGTQVFFTGFNMQCVEKQEGEFIVRLFTNSGSAIECNEAENIFEQYGEMPLPPYIQERSAPDDRYQTVYHKGISQSAAAPTAGLHFTEELLAELRLMGVKSAEITLDVGLGTFKPVECSDIRKHPMHKEKYNISEESAELYRSTRSNGGRIICVGTTSLRALEACLAQFGEIRRASSWADIYLYPGKPVLSIDALITNFHLPRSTLLMLTAAFAGYENIMRAYAYAAEKRYRFFSYGDAMLIA